MDLLLTIEQFGEMNDPSEIKDSLQTALSAIDLTENWNMEASVFSQSKEPDNILSLQNQVMRSATRILSAEKDLEATHADSSENHKKLKWIEEEIASQKESMQEMQCERSKEEMKALKDFMDAMDKARKDFRDRKRVFAEKREAKLRLMAAAEKRLEILRVSHEELSRVYAKKSVELEKKLERERLLYTLNLESLAKAQEEAEVEKADVEDDSCSRTTEGSSDSGYD